MTTQQCHCIICNECAGELYGIAGSNDWICHECLDKHSQYGLCLDCNIVYGDNDLYEGDDGNFYCKEHIINHQDKLSNDEEDLIEKINKD